MDEQKNEKENQKLHRNKILGNRVPPSRAVLYYIKKEKNSLPIFSSRL
jgi:hypothetical protein